MVEAFAASGYQAAVGTAAEAEGPNRKPRVPLGTALGAESIKAKVELQSPQMNSGRRAQIRPAYDAPAFKAQAIGIYEYARRGSRLFGYFDTFEQAKARCEKTLQRVEAATSW